MTRIWLTDGFVDLARQEVTRGGTRQRLTPTERPINERSTLHHATPGRLVRPSASRRSRRSGRSGRGAGCLSLQPAVRKFCAAKAPAAPERG